MINLVILNLENVEINYNNEKKKMGKLRQEQSSKTQK